MKNKAITPEEAKDLFDKHDDLKALKDAEQAKEKEIEARKENLEETDEFQELKTAKEELKDIKARFEARLKELFEQSNQLRFNFSKKD